MKAKGFEELYIWQKARELVNIIYTLTRKDRFSNDWALTDQIRRAAISVMSNIAEGFERGSNSAFIQFLYIAKGSCGEVRSQGYIANDQTYINKEELNKLIDITKQTSAMISNFISYLKKSNLKGSKFTK
ncbi:MAG: four helix bundle protein [Planctomycetota bacterium]